MYHQRYIHSKKDRREALGVHLLSKLSRIGTTAVGAAGIVLATQALYVGLTTPRLPPPPFSGKNFARKGLVVVAEDEEEIHNRRGRNSDDNNYQHNSSSYFQKKDEICIILLGDSPVEGIGNTSHDLALGGQTAYAISRTFHKPVRYWSLGKSGLTTSGIELKMIPLMKEITKEYRIDLVVISAGVNNVLSGHSSTVFKNELNSLLHAIQKECRLRRNVPVIFLGLLDFSLMPFLPFPLSNFAGWRSRKLQRALIDIVDQWSEQRIVDIAYMPDVDEVLNSEKVKEGQHPLLCGVKQDQLKRLKMDDFFADDGFHPARFGTIMIGNLIAQTWKDNLGSM